MKNAMECDEIVESVLFPDLSEFVDREELTPRAITPVSKWAMAKIGTFQARLEALNRDQDQRLRNKRHKPRLQMAKIIQAANLSFGFNGWSSRIESCEVVEENFDEDNSKNSLSQRAEIRITLRDGTELLGSGIGECHNLPLKSTCYEESRKKAVTEGLRSAFLNMHKLLDTPESRGDGGL